MATHQTKVGSRLAVWERELRGVSFKRSTRRVPWVVGTNIARLKRGEAAYWGLRPAEASGRHLFQSCLESATANLEQVRGKTPCLLTQEGEKCHLEDLFGMCIYQALRLARINGENLPC